MVLFWKCDHNQLSEKYVLTKYREIDMDFTIFGSCLIENIGAIFAYFSTLMSAIYRVFIYVLDDNIAYVVLFQNLGNLKTNTTKIPVLVLQKLSLLDSNFLDCFIRKIATICSIPWFATCYISKSSTRWHILLFIVSFVLPYITRKCRFHKIDMDFEIVASTLKLSCQNQKCWQSSVRDLWPCDSKK